jgi:hypothetical protein
MRYPCSHPRRGKNLFENIPEADVARAKVHGGRRGRRHGRDGQEPRVPLLEREAHAAPLRAAEEQPAAPKFQKLYQQLRMSP